MNHYTDHLGNLRLAFMDKPEQNYKATMELNSEANDFAHYFTTRSSEKGYMSANSSKTDTNAPVGLWKSMSIQKGDKVTVSSQSFFSQDVTSNNTTFPIGVFIQNTFNTYNVDENGNASPNPYDLNNLSLGIGVIPSNTNPAPSLPDAGFAIAFYKEGEDTAPFHTEYVYASQKNIWQYLEKEYIAEHNGRVEIFCFNTSDIPVYFDNFNINLKPSMIVQENHYYPFGLNLAGTEKQGHPDHKFQ